MKEPDDTVELAFGGQRLRLGELLTLLPYPVLSALNSQKLPLQVQEQAREAYRQFKQDPGHPSLRFKKVHPELPIYSARISKNYRAVGQLDGDTVIGFGLVHTQSMASYYLSVVASLTNHCIRTRKAKDYL
jgi:hypothetical protein